MSNYIHRVLTEFEYLRWLQIMKLIVHPFIFYRANDDKNKSFDDQTESRISDKGENRTEDTSNGNIQTIHETILVELITNRNSGKKFCNENDI